MIDTAPYNDSQKGASAVVGNLILVLIVVAGISVGGSLFLTNFITANENPVATVEYEQSMNSEIENASDPSAEYVEETSVINVQVTSMERADSVTIIHYRTGNTIGKINTVGGELQVGILTNNMSNYEMNDGEITRYTGPDYDAEPKLQDGDIIYAVAEYESESSIINTFEYTDFEN